MIESQMLLKKLLKIHLLAEVEEVMLVFSQ